MQIIHQLLGWVGDLDAGKDKELPLLPSTPTDEKMAANSSPKKWAKILASLVTLIGVLAALAQISGYSFKDFYSPKEPTAIEDTIPKDSSKTTIQTNPDSTELNHNKPSSTPKTAPNNSQTPKKPKPINTPKKDLKKDPIPTKPNTKEGNRNANTTDTKPPPSSQNQNQLTLDCKTNKGTQNLVFKKDELLRLYYKVNKACLLRIIYKLADGRLILLENDLQISSTQVGQWIEIGDAFEVAEPFGEEQLYVFAQNTPFPTLQIENTPDGYPHIKEGLPQALSKSRGLKKKQWFAEYRLDIQTQGN